jgi:arylsulfatase
MGWYDQTATEYHGTSPAEKYTEAFLRWEDQQSGPWAACINYMDAHAPYEPVEEYNRWGDERLSDLQDDFGNNWELYNGQRHWWEKQAMEGLYDGAIRQIDGSIKTLITSLEERGSLENTLVVITGDHGETFGEASNIHPEFRLTSHWGGISELLFHVPLIVNFPNQSSGQQITKEASLTEFPSVVERVRNGTWCDDEFAADTVFAYADLDERWQDDKSLQSPEGERFLQRYAGEAKAIYKNDNGKVRKFVEWNDKSKVVEIPDAHNAWVVGTATNTPFSDPVAQLTMEDVKANKTSEDISEETRTTLERLGYIN